MGWIYCGQHAADAREHYLPQCRGRFHNFEPLLGKLCQECNEGIGGTLEREFCRRSPEAVLRSVHWIKGQHKRRQGHSYQPEKIGGQHLYFFAPDPETGQSILWQTDKEPRTVKERSQLVICDDAGEVTQHIPIPAEMTTGRDLVELFKAYSVTFPIPKVQVIAASGDEERVQGLFSAIDVDVPMQRRAAGRVAQQFFTGVVGPKYFRALAKIGFHYALKYIPTITGSEGAFRALREFIRNGSGNHEQFLVKCDPASNPSGPPGHVLTAVANPYSPIVVNMQFFAGCKTVLPQWRLVLGDNPTVLFVEQVSAHFFAYTEEEDGRLTGGEIVPLRVMAR
jgi:hypothetical protein